MPYAESGSDSNLWFSFNVGRMHYIAISTEHHYNPGRAWRESLFFPYLTCFLTYLYAHPIRFSAVRMVRKWSEEGKRQPPAPTLDCSGKSIPCYPFIFIAQQNKNMTKEISFFSMVTGPCIVRTLLTTRVSLRIAMWWLLAFVRCWNLWYAPALPYA